MRRLFLLLFLATAACSGKTTTGTADTAPLPCDVDDVLVRRCSMCHSNPPQFGSPMAIVTHGDVTAPSPSDPTTPVYEMIERRIHDDAKPMPQAPNARLSPADMATLDAWVAAGAPAGTSACMSSIDGGAVDGSPPPPPPSDSGPPVDGSIPDTCPNVHIAPASAWSMPSTTDDEYVCYGFDVTTAVPRQAISFAPRLDNTRIVHHMILFESSSAMSPTPAPCTYAESVQWKMVYGWAPGGQPMDLPPEAGFPLGATTTHYVMQIHYNNVNHLAGQQDSTGVDVCTTTELRPNDADILAFGSTQFTIQPHQTLDWTCNFTVPSYVPQLHAFAAIPHMHQIGKSIDTQQLPGGTGAPVDLGGQASWNFQTQTWMPVSATVNAGDVVRTRCVWSNPGDTAVGFGPYTADEMCFSFTLYYPKIAALPSWVLPAENASCAVTP